MPHPWCGWPHCQICRKKSQKIQKLIDNQNLEKLRALSQQNIQNAYYKLRFGFQDKNGIHGACPMEMLHALYLGTFKCVRDAFFEQIGKTSKLNHHVEALCKRYGFCLSHQSSQDMTQMKFAIGVNADKLMAKDHSWVLLCLACVVHSSAGQTELAKRKNSRLKAQLRTGNCS